MAPGGTEPIPPRFGAVHLAFFTALDFVIRHGAAALAAVRSAMRHHG